MKRTSLDDEMVRRFLTEGEEGEEDLFGDTDTDVAEDEPAETPTDDEASTDAEEPGDEEETGDEESEEPKEDVEPIPRADSVLDAEIDAVLIDYESIARDEQSENEEIGVKEESTTLYKKGLSILLEEEEKVDPIDIEVFAGEVARLIKNYDNLLDMESLLYTKAVEFITRKYSEEKAKELEDSLELSHGISLKPDTEKEDEINTPIAIGANPAAASA